MNGKVLKVVEYDLKFGGNARMLNVFGVFKYNATGSMYIVYADADMSNYVIYYSSAHVKNNSILAMNCRDRKEEEIIKEYIYKVTNGEDLSAFTMISLTEIEGVEIIASSHFEVKPEIFMSLVDKTIPKPSVQEETAVSKKKKNPLKTFLLFLIFVAIIGVGGYFYFATLNSPNEGVAKKIVCEKSYPHSELQATVEEMRTYNFNYNDELQFVDKVLLYQFSSEEEYQEVMSKGIYYHYMPSALVDGGFKPDDEGYNFKMITKERVDDNYREPTNYEEVMNYYKRNGFNCSENIEKE